MAEDVNLLLRGLWT